MEDTKPRRKKNKKTLQKWCPKLLRPMPKKRRAELASNIKTAFAGFLQATRAPLGATLSKEEREGHKAKAEKKQ